MVRKTVSKELGEQAILSELLYEGPAKNDNSWIEYMGERNNTGRENADVGS